MFTQLLPQRLLIRLALRIHLFALKKAYKTTTRLNYLIRSRLRLLDANAQLEGADPHYDEINLLAAARILEPDDFLAPAEPRTCEHDIYKHVRQELLLRYNAVREEVEELVEQTRADETIVFAHRSHKRVLHYISRLSLNGNSSSPAAGDSDSHDRLDTKGLFELDKSIRRDLRATRKLIADRQAIKIDLKEAPVTALASTLLGIFIVSGYFYQSLLLSAFGHSVSHYFSLYSYLSSSMDSIYNAGISAGLAIVGAFFYLDEESRSPRGTSIPQTSFDWLRLAMYAVLLVGLYVFRHEPYKPIFFFYLYGLGILGGAHLSARISLAHFKQPMYAMFILCFLAFFFVGMYVDVAKKVYQLRHNQWSDLPTYSVHYSSVDIELPRTVAILSSSDSHIFVLDQERRAYAVRTEYIALVRRRP